MKNFYRRYKISQITNDSITLEEKEIVEFILDKIKDLTLFIDEYGCHHYMNSKGEFIFQQDDKNYALIVRYYGFWSVLFSKYKYILTHDDIAEIIFDIISKKFSNLLLKKIYRRNFGTSEIEYHYLKTKSISRV